MAYDKVIDSTLLNAGMTATANAIRAKTGGTTSIKWDAANGFKAAVEEIDERGVTLPDLGDTAAQPSDIASGKVLYDDKGNSVTGTLAESEVGTKVMVGDDIVLAGTSGDTVFSIGGVYGKRYIDDDSFHGFICRAGTNFYIRNAQTSLFGNATPEQVAKGATFTSEAGLLAEGELVEILAGASIGATKDITVKRHNNGTIRIMGKTNWGDVSGVIVRNGAYLNITANDSDFDGIFEIGSSEDANLDAFIQGQVTTIQNENITEVGKGTFAYTDIENVNLPNCITVKNSAFSNCNSLKDINLPQCKNIGDYAFQQANIEELTLPKGEVFGYYCFSYSKIKTITLPIGREVDNYCFSNCSLLTNIHAPLLENISSYCFQRCVSLKEVQFNSLKKISDNAFNGSTNIFYITFSPTEKVILENSNAFLDTPFASGKGYIFVPAEIVDTYKQDSVWKTYKDRIFAIAPTIIEPSQSGIVEQTKSRDYSLDLKFFDSVPEVSFSNSSICEITNKKVTQNGLSFTLNGINLGEENIAIIATTGEQQATLILPIEVIEKLPYEVNNRSTTYGFYLNDNDYYESNNKGKDASYAVCRVTFTLSKETQVYLDCINYAENNWDYGILSNIDTELSLSYTADASAKIYKNFKGLNSSSVQIVTYTIPAGEHFIDIKYLKDASNSSNNDSLQFKIRFE